jgi:putative DNA primase/helicase
VNTLTSTIFDSVRAQTEAGDRLTDAGAAERLCRLHGDDLRFDHRRSRWLLWQGHRWTPDLDAAVTRVAIKFAREWQKETVDIADLEQKGSVFKFAVRLERRDALTNLLTLARALKPIADAGDRWDEDPWLLGVPNGVVDLRTGTLRAGRRDDRITMQTRVAYDPGAACPRWERFLSEVFDPHPELVDFVHRAVGYSLTGITTEQALFLGYGSGSNGKGTFANRLQRLLGDYAFNMPFATIEFRDRAAIPNDVAALVAKRFVIAAELNDGTRLNEGRVKALTGCDPITARFLHSEFFTFEPVAKFWLNVNHKPIVKDDSLGFWRRVRLIPFTNTFPVNDDVTKELDAEEAGILAWAIRGCLAWQQRGLDAPNVVVNATRDYRDESDDLAAFLNEVCEYEPLAEVGAAELFEHYKRWADRAGLSERERLTATKFGRKISERFRHEHRERGKVYFGVARRVG